MEQPFQAATPVLEPALPGKQADRLFFIDNIRWLLIADVICHHAAVTYSHLGGWYYYDGPEPGIGTRFLLATFETFNQAFFMGFLFLIAGYFVPRAYDTKGWFRFLRDRTIRLGIPSLFYMLVIDPVIVYWLVRDFVDPSRPSLAQIYPSFVMSRKLLHATGPMWFAVALLGFCAIYASVRILGPARARGWNSLPNHRQVIGLILLMGSCSFLVRIVRPIGTSILNMQPCYFSQYILLFVVGILAYRGNWLLRIPHAFGIFWMKLALFVCIPTWVILIFASGALKGDTKNLLGGPHWESAAFSYWEALMCLGMCLGLTVLFRDGFNRQSSFTAWMSQNSFAVYLFHPPLLIAVTLLLRPLNMPNLGKFGMACLLAVPITFLVSGLLRSKVPRLHKLL